MSWLEHSQEPEPQVGFRDMRYILDVLAQRKMTH